MLKPSIYFICIISILQHNMLCKDSKQTKTQDETQVFQELKNEARIRGSIIQCLKKARQKFVQLKTIKEWGDNKNKHRHLIQQFRSLQARIYQELAKRRYKAYNEKKLFTKSKLLQELFSKHKNTSKTFARL